MIDPPLAMQGQRKNGQDHHLHAVRHPAKPDNEAEYNLEPAKADVVDGLGHSEGVVWYNSAGRGYKRKA